MNYRDMNDYELLYMVSDLSDDNTALLLEKYEPFLWKKCRKWEAIFKKMGYELEDLEQEVRLTFLSAISSYNEEVGASFYTYLNLAVDARFKNLLRSMQTHKNKAIVEALSLSSPTQKENITLMDVLMDPKNDVNLTLETHELEAAILSFLYELPPEMASILELSFHGYSVKSLSLLFEKSPRAISSILSRNRKKLKDYLVKKNLYVI